MGFFRALGVLIPMISSGLALADTPLAQSFNFDGVLLDSSSNPITTVQVVDFKIFDPSGTCLLYEESQSLTPDVQGNFSVQIGSPVGSAQRAAADPGLAWPVIFQNNMIVRSSGTGCALASGYTPGSGDQRLLRVTVGSTVLSPDFPITSVPMATVAQSLQGKVVSDFVTATGSSVVSGQVLFNSGGSLAFGTSSAHVGFSAPATVPASVNWQLPPTDGASGTCLSTSGTGVLSWASCAGGGGGGGLPTTGGTLTGGLTISAGGLSVTGGINDNGGAISNVGNVVGSGALAVAAGGTNQTLSLQSSGTANVAIGTGSGTQFQVLDGGTGTVNYLTVAGAPAGGTPVLGANGSDANININLLPKGSGQVIANGALTTMGAISASNGMSLNGNFVLNNNSGSGPQTIYGANSGNPGQNLYLDSTMAATKGNVIIAPGGGAVGIGTTTPAQALHLNGAPNAPFGVLATNLGTGNGSQTEFRAKNNGSASTAVGVNGTAFSAGGLYSANTGYLMSDSPSGLNIGVTYAGSGAIRFFSGGGVPAQQMIIDPYGNIGIGTNAPAADLDIRGAAKLSTTYTSGYLYPALTLNGTFGLNGGHTWSIAGNSGGGVNETNYLRVSNETGVKFGIGPAGKVGIGLAISDSSPNSFPLSTLDVLGGVAIGGFAGTSPAPANGMIISGSVGVGKPTPAYPLDVMGDISTSGCLHYNAGTMGTCASDERLKKDIRPMTLGLDAVLGLQPKYYRYNGLGGEQESATDQMGVIAQDVEKVAPDLVSTRQVKLHADDEKKTEIKVVNYGAFTYMVINAIKDFHAKWLGDAKIKDQKIATLDGEVAELKARNADLEERLRKLELLLSRTPAADASR